jgi:hypothetical protein
MTATKAPQTGNLAMSYAAIVLFSAPPNLHILRMHPAPSIIFRNSRKAHGLAIAGFAVLLVTGLLIMAASQWTVAGTLAGALLSVSSAVQIHRLVGSFLDRTPMVEIYDHCVIDARFLKEWVLWEDVREIAVTDSGTVGLVVEDEARYAIERKSLCGRLAEISGVLWGLPKVLISASALECTPFQLLTAIRRASRPYGIPIRRIKTASPPPG